MTTSMDEKIAAASDAAVAARELAYAPYSDFLMGAAVVGDDGTVVSGVLIENVSLGLAMCAERVALFTAVTQRVQPVVLAVCAKQTDGKPTFPCGACLQVALEMAGPELMVVAIDPDGMGEQSELGALLPCGPKRHTPDYSSGD